MAKKSADKKQTLVRTPIVAVMGHVDHGKTSLLDAIRGTKVQASEVGGITQNTRAHQIEYKNQKISFIDTPGHEAFSQMRQRGAKVTDIALIVVAADDGVQPQTKESIKFALGEKVPIIIAINKIDLPNKNIAKVKQQLATAGVLLEEQGGDAIVVEVSAVKKTGLDDLLDNILLVAEVSELKKNKVSQGIGTGFVLESKSDKHLGNVALMLIKSGEITNGKYLMHADGHVKVRQLLNHNQEKIEKAEEGDPVWIIGLDKNLEVGEVVIFYETEKEAKEFQKKVEKGEETIEAQTEESAEGEDNNLDLLAAMLSKAQSDEDTEFLHLVIKADSQGTLEVLKDQLDGLETDVAQIKILKAETGEVNEKDVITAKNAHGIVIAFQVEVPKKVQEIARKERVLVRGYEVIYELFDEIEEVLGSLGQATEEEVEVARAKVKQVFKLSNGQYVAGSEVTKGTILKGYKAYIERNGERVNDGRISMLKRGKEDAKEVKRGVECGILMEPNVEMQAGDEVVCFKVEKI